MYKRQGRSIHPRNPRAAVKAVIRATAREVTRATVPREVIRATAREVTRATAPREVIRATVKEATRRCV